jgi:hypothetical protein
MSLETPKRRTLGPSTTYAQSCRRRYEIELISSPQIARAANTVRRTTLDYLNTALARQPTDAARRVAREAVSQMIIAAQRDLVPPLNSLQ